MHFHIGLSNLMPLKQKCEFSGSKLFNLKKRKILFWWIWAFFYLKNNRILLYGKVKKIYPDISSMVWSPGRSSHNGHIIFTLAKRTFFFHRIFLLQLNNLSLMKWEYFNGVSDILHISSYTIVNTTGYQKSNVV